MVWFTLALRPGPAKVRHVPRAPLPDQGVTSFGAMSHALRQRALPLLHRSYGLMRQTKSLLLISVSFIQQVFAGCCQSLLEDGPSRCYLCNPCIGAWTLTPGCLSGASVRFFPESNSLTSVAPSSAHPSNRRNATSTTTLISGRQSFRYVQAPMLASPPDCTYRAKFTSCGQPGRLRHAMDWRLPPRTVVSLHDRIGQLSWRDFHPPDCSLIGRSLQLRGLC